MNIKKALRHSNLVIAIIVMAKIAMSKHTMNVLGFQFGKSQNQLTIKYKTRFRTYE